MSEQLSQFQLLECDVGYILEALLLSNDFESPRLVSRKLLTVWHQVRASSYFRKLSCQQCTSDEILPLRSLKSIVASVAIKVSQSKEEFEKLNLQQFLLREEIREYFAVNTSLSEQQQSDKLLLAILDEVFQNRDHDKEWFVKQWKRSEASDRLLSYGEVALWPHIEAATKELQLVPRQTLLNQAQLLARGLASTAGVILAGASGLGKTTAYQVLARALDLYRRHLDQDPAVSAAATELSVKAPHQDAQAASSSCGSNPEPSPERFVDVCVVLPMALTLTQLYGSTALDGKGHTKSILGRLIRLAQEKFTLVRSNDSSQWGSIGPPDSSRVVLRGLSPLMAMQALLWAVFDGSIEPTWLEYLSCVLMRKPAFTILESAVLSFEDGECMTVPPNLHFIFETLSMQHCSPSILHLNSVICFDSSEAAEGTTAEGLSTSEPIHKAYIRRYLLIQREAWTDNASPPPSTSAAQINKSALALQTYDIVEKWLLGTELLNTIFSVIQEYGSSVKLSFLQRVVNLLSLLQVLLYSISTATIQNLETSPPASPTTLDPSEVSTTATDVTRAEDQKQKVNSRLEIRVEMACLYALLWGFAGCTSDNLPLQMLIQGLLKTNFEQVADTWLGCGGKDCNLFETLIDIPNVRFVSVHSAFSSPPSRSDVPRPLINSTPGPGTLSSSILFVPTPSSVLTHAVMKDALRAGRGVVLIGHANSRRTKLLRNFLHQVEFVNAIIKFDQHVNNNPSDNSTTKSEAGGRSNSDSTSALSRQGSDIATLAGGGGGDKDQEVAKTLESVEKIRLHQISLVTKLAAKFRRLYHEATAVVNSRSRPSNSATASTVRPPPPLAPEALLEPDTKWNITPGFPVSTGSAEMTAKFDNGDVVPFFFTMNQHTGGVSEIAQCMERMLQRERTGVFEPPPGKIAILIIDDLHLPVPEPNERPIEHASCHAYLRSAYEHSRVHAGDDGSCIRIENLLMVASIATSVGQVHSSNKSDSLTKLVNQFFPILAPACTLQEIHHIYTTLTLSQWDRPGAPLERLPQVVKHVLPLVVAGTTVLWEKLRRSPWTGSTTSRALGLGSFSLHDLSRVYEGICSVAPAYLLDVDTFMRLWTHECLRTLGDPVNIQSPEYSEWITKQIWRLRRIMEAVGHRQDSAQLINDTMGHHSSDSGAGKTGASQHQQQKSGPTNYLNAGFNSGGFLAYLSAEYLNKKPTTTAAHHHQTLPISSEDTASLWGFIPSDLYYQRCIGGDTIATLNISSANPPSVTGGDRQQRNSIKFLRRKSVQSGGVGPSSSSLATLWVYAELSSENASREAAKAVVQHLFGAIRTFSTTNSKEREVMSSLLALQLPSHAPQVSLSLVRSYQILTVLVPSELIMKQTLLCSV